MNTIESFLQQSALFARLDETAIVRIAAQSELVHFGDGEVIFNESDDGDGMYIIGSGQVRGYKKMGESQRELMTLDAGEHFGEMALISAERRTATIRAASDVSCVRIDQDGFNHLMDSEPTFAQRMLHVITERLKRSDEASTRDILQAHQALIFSLAQLAESRDPETGAHLYRVRDYCTHLAEILADHPKFSQTITPSFIESIYLVSPLHDIGKVAIPDGILLKQGKLTEPEYQIMTTHTTVGARSLDTVIDYCNFEMFHMARRIILYHHERFDGKGYPRGAKGEDIPIEARIMSLADVYDALLSRRVYKPPYAYETAKQKIAESAGKRFDPDMTAVMIEHIAGFEAIHSKYDQDTADI
jgi:HD-GYP domain-containing protein (c-di-GMP phosphodiesterase class II)